MPSSPPASRARAREAKREEAAAELTRQAKEERRTAARKDEALEQEAAEAAAEELRERAGKDVGKHAAELRRHKGAFVELASAQRQLEADLTRAARLADTAEVERKAVLERHDEAAAAAADLSAEAARLRRDADHKDKILSAMLRKSKINMEDREMLVREVKMCKARRKQAERCHKMWESRAQRRGSRSSARCAAAADHPECSDKLAPDGEGAGRH